MSYSSLLLLVFDNVFMIFFGVFMDEYPYITTTNPGECIFKLYKYIFYTVGLCTQSCCVLYVHCSTKNGNQVEKYLILVDLHS